MNPEASRVSEPVPTWVLPGNSPIPTSCQNIIHGLTCTRQCRSKPMGELHPQTAHPGGQARPTHHAGYAWDSPQCSQRRIQATGASDAATRRGRFHSIRGRYLRVSRPHPPTAVPGADSLADWIRLRAWSRFPHSPHPPPALEHGRGGHPIGAMGLLAGTGHRPGSPKPGGQLDFCAGCGCQQQSGQPGHQHSILRRGPSNSGPSGCGICRGSPAGQGAGNGQAFSGPRRYRGGFPSVFAGDFRAAPTVRTDRVGSLSGGDRGRCHGDHDGPYRRPGLGERPPPPGHAFGRGTGTSLEERTGVSGFDRNGLHEDEGANPRILERRSGGSGHSGRCRRAPGSTRCPGHLWRTAGGGEEWPPFRGPCGPIG